MTTFVDNFFRTPPQTSTQIFFAGIFLVPVLGVLDYLTGAEISFSIFYLLPIYLVAWYVGRWPAIFVSCLAAIVWFSAELFAGAVYTHPLIPFWNMGVRLFVFVLTAWLVSEIRLRDARRRALEHIFFHDVLNMMTAVHGFAEYLHDSSSLDHRDVCATIFSASKQVIQEIEDQRVLSAVEHHELPIELTSLNSRLLLDQVLGWYGYQEKVEKINLRLAPESEEIVFISDQTLITRVLGNMVKNALEATQSGETVTAGCRKSGRDVEFWVHNPQHIPPQLHSQIFKPLFSTKGGNRGMGAYSMRLLSRELGGDMSFTSSPGEGTTFVARYPLK